MRVRASYHLTVQVGETLRQGQPIQEGPATEEAAVAPVSGTVTAIRFDPASHEFILEITPSQ